MFTELDSRFQKTIEHFSEELKSVRTGRANPSLVTNIMVMAYGSPLPIPQLANISVPEAKMLVIEPWDKSLLKEIEKAITQSNLGINPLNDGTSVRLIMPQMTEENRKNLIKILGHKSEQAKIAIRSVRDSIREEITQQERNKEITQDDRYALFEEVDKMTKEFTARIEELTTKKEEEIMTI